MSYDLDFWKYKPGVRLDHQAVYEQLSDGKWVEGVAEIPTAEIIARVKQVFAEGWVQLVEDTWDSQNGTFQVFVTPQFFRVDCYDLDYEDMNKLIGIAREFGCPLYDPQAGERYDKGGAEG